MEIDYNFGKKKKKRKEFVLKDDENNDQVIEKFVIYSYEDMLNRAYSKIDKPTESDKLKMKIPKICRDGSKKTVWINFRETCLIINRPKEHLMNYVSREFGAICSINAQDILVVRGIYKSNRFESLVRNYIREYVMCTQCKSMKTRIVKEGRLTFIICSKCNSSRSIKV